MGDISEWYEDSGPDDWEYDPVLGYEWIKCHNCGEMFCGPCGDTICNDCFYSKSVKGKSDGISPQPD